MDPKPLTGTTLAGRYDIGRMIGGGGMGHVYEATHSGTGRKVAIKVISTGEMAKDAHIVGRFQREAKAAGSVDSQNICQVLDTGTDDETGAPFMVMEYMTGEDVQQLLQRTGPLSPDLALRITAQAALGLSKAHGVDVVHRDMKPANLFLAKKDDGEVVVKLLDFGIAKVKMEQAQSAENAGLTRTGMMLGSPLYMSPEQARGSKNIDHRADIWSLGVVLYQCLCGRTPFQHVDALGELIMAICSERPPPVQDFAPWVPPEIAGIVHKSLQLRADDRYQTAAEMYEAIRAFLPNGWAGIQASSLVSLSETQRAVAQRRLTLPPAGPQSMFPQSMSSPSLPPPPLMAGGISGVAGTTGGVSGSMRESMAGTSPGTRSGSSAILVGSVAFGVVVAGTIAFYALRGVIMPPPPPPAVAQAAPAPPPTTAPADTTPATKVTPAANDRSVKLVVIPDDAKVTVDGNPAKVKNGVVEISGPLGSVHKVKLVSGKQEVEEDVVVTEIGAQPPKLAIDTAAGPPKLGGPVGAKKDPEPAKTGAPAAPTGPKPGIETKFE